MVMGNEIGLNFINYVSAI